MKQTINLHQFRDAFRDYDRQNNFTYEGLAALFDWLEELDDSCGTESKLDVIALCCDFTEYQGIFSEIIDVYPDIRCIDDLLDHTPVIPVEGGGYIIQNF
jgi:hypothetical protein